MADLSKNVAPETKPTLLPNDEDLIALREALETFEKGRSVMNKGYAYFGGANLLEVIDDWTKRWNGYIPPMNPLLDQTQSNIFINFTRNAIISYLAKVAMSPIKAHIVAVNKKSGLVNKQFAQVLEDLNQYSLNEENGDQKFLQAALECVTKGTVIVYEGYMKDKQKMKSPVQFDAVTGKLKWEEKERTLFDNCFQKVVPLEDFYITNVFESDVQKQPKIIWRRITSYSEGKKEFGHYANWKYVVKGNYTIANDVQTYYRNELLTELGKDQIEILRYYCKSDNLHIVLINGVVLYNGPIPFKDGNYPFAKGINEPFGNDFFYGNGHPNKYLGEQDLINTFINAMADKNLLGLTPTGLTSDLDDLIDDDVMEVGKVRKVGDVEKWKWWEAPEITSGEMSMFNTILSLARESANTDAGALTTPRGGKMQTRQILLKQQEMMQKVSFNMNFLEDMERDRTVLRLSHLLQFYSIPKIEKITGKKGKEIEQLTYRDASLSDTQLSSGQKGNKIIKLVDGDTLSNPDSKTELQDKMSVMEMHGEMQGVPTEVLALSVDSFNDFGLQVQVVKFSSYQKNQALDQAARLEFAQWRVGVAQVIPIGNPQGLVEWVEEAFDVDSEKFETKQGQAPQQNQGQPQGQGGDQGPLQQNRPSSLGQSMAQLA